MKITARPLLTAGLITGLLLSMTNPTQTFAATADNGKESITLSPTSKQYQFDPGTTKDDKFTIINDGETDYEFKVFAQPYSVNGEEYEPDFFTVRENTDLEKWVKFPKSTYFLRAGQSVEVPYSVVVPADAIPGGHYGAIFAETQPSQRSNGTSIQRKSRVGSLVYATVNGKFETGGSFEGIRTTPLQFKPPIRSEVVLRNTGDTDFGVTTVFAVDDILGNRKLSETKEYRVLPKTKRAVQLQWDKAPSFGLFKVTTSAKFLDQQTSKTTYVLMAPFGFYLTFVLLLFVAVIFFVQKRR